MGCGGCVRVEPLWLPLLMGGRWTWPARCTLMREIWNQWRFHTSRQTGCWLYILHRRRQTESRSWCWYSAQNNAPWLFKKKDSYWSVEHHRLIVSPNFITGFKIHVTKKNDLPAVYDKYGNKLMSSSLRGWGQSSETCSTSLKTSVWDVDKTTHTEESSSQSCFSFIQLVPTDSKGSFYLSHVTEE